MATTHTSEVRAHAVPPGASARAVRLRQRVTSPIARFLHIEAASGLLLLGMTAIALAWANSPWAASYEALWHSKVGVLLGPWRLEQSLHFVVNDVLMVLFFFVVGLEIRRELHHGELSELKRASLPLFAALGGMVAPALIYFALNPDPPARAGWGVPMATDIAFAVGVLALAGPRVPAALRVLLLALAVIDDIGAILVIALFYSDGVQPAWLGLAALAVLAVFVQQRLGLRSPWAYVPAGVALWAGMLGAGVHPTLAGVLLGLLTPVNAWYGERGFVDVAERELEQLRTGSESARAEAEIYTRLTRLEQARREAMSPLLRIERGLHPWVAFGVMPVFALANAGVTLGSIELTGNERIALGVFLGLLVGKPLGVALFAVGAAKLGLCALPHGVGFRGLLTVGTVAGIGFTMAIFVAGLAFEQAAMLGVAKLAILAASLVAGVATLVIGRRLLPPLGAELAAVDVHAAERSTEH